MPSQEACRASQKSSAILRSSAGSGPNAPGAMRAVVASVSGSPVPTFSTSGREVLDQPARAQTLGQPPRSRAPRVERTRHPKKSLEHSSAAAVATSTRSSNNPPSRNLPVSSSVRPLRISRPVSMLGARGRVRSPRARPRLSPWWRRLWRIVLARVASLSNWAFGRAVRRRAGRQL